MALSILDGNQSATTLSTIVTSGQHIPAHTVVSLGTQAISNITSAVSGTAVTFGLVGGTVTANNFTLTNVLQYDGSHYFLKVGGVATTGGTSFPVYVAGSVTVGNSVTIGSLPAISGTVTANLGGAFLNTSGGYQPVQFSTGLPIANEKDGITFDRIPFLVEGSVTIGSALPAGTNRIGVVTIGNIQRDGDGVQTSLLTEVGSGYLLNKSFLGAGTAQIGSVTASISGTVPISISSVTVGSVPPIQWSNANSGNAPTTVNQNAPLPVQLYTGAVPSSVTIGAIIANSITIGSLPSISGTVTANLSGTKGSDEGTTQLPTLPVQLVDLSEQIIGVASNPLPISGTVTIGSLPAISGTVTANTFAVQGTAVTTSNFTSTTASTVLASYNATREVLTIFNEGAGNLHICAGATCTTIAYQVRLSAGDYYEVPNHQTTITHSAVFATAGTARIVQIT